MFWMALASTVLAAVMSAMTNGPLMAVLQTTVAPEMQGRVFTLMASMATAISPVGLAVAGRVADLLGVQVKYIVGGAVCMGMGIADGCWAGACSSERMRRLYSHKFAHGRLRSILKVESAFDRRRPARTESRPKFYQRVQGVSPGRCRLLVLRHEYQGDYVELSE